MQVELPNPSASARDLFARRGLRWRATIEGCGRPNIRYFASARRTADGQVLPLEVEGNSLGDAIEKLAVALAKQPEGV